MSEDKELPLQLNKSVSRKKRKRKLVETGVRQRPQSSTPRMGCDGVSLSSTSSSMAWRPEQVIHAHNSTFKSKYGAKSTTAVTSVGDELHQRMQYQLEAFHRLFQTKSNGQGDGDSIVGQIKHSSTDAREYTQREMDLKQEEQEETEGIETSERILKRAELIGSSQQMAVVSYLSLTQLIRPPVSLEPTLSERNSQNSLNPRGILRKSRISMDQSSASVLQIIEEFEDTLGNTANSSTFNRQLSSRKSVRFEDEMAFQSMVSNVVQPRPSTSILSACPPVPPQHRGKILLSTSLHQGPASRTQGDVLLKSTSPVHKIRSTTALRRPTRPKTAPSTLRYQNIVKSVKPPSSSAHSPRDNIIPAAATDGSSKIVDQPFLPVVQSSDGPMEVTTSCTDSFHEPLPSPSLPAPLEMNVSDNHVNPSQSLEVCNVENSSSCSDVLLETNKEDKTLVMSPMVTPGLPLRKSPIPSSSSSLSSGNNASSESEIQLIRLSDEKHQIEHSIRPLTTSSWLASRSQLLSMSSISTEAGSHPLKQNNAPECSYKSTNKRQPSQRIFPNVSQTYQMECNSPRLSSMERWNNRDIKILLPFPRPRTATSHNSYVDSRRLWQSNPQDSISSSSYSIGREFYHWMTEKETDPSPTMMEKYLFRSLDRLNERLQAVIEKQSSKLPSPQSTNLVNSQ